MASDESTLGVRLIAANSDTTQLDRLLTLAREAGSETIALISGTVAEVDTLRIHHGQITLPRLARTVTAAAVTAAQLAPVEELIEQADGPDVARDAPPYDSIDPPAPPTEASTAEILLLGPLGASGLATSLSAFQQEMAAFLAVNPAGVTGERLKAALWPDAAPATQTVLNRISEFSDAVGERIGERVGDRRRYRLPPTLTSDWARFQALAHGDVAERRQALSLVRGEPLEDVKNDWPDAGGHRPAIEQTIVDLAAELGEQLLADGEPAAAGQAADAGLRAGPYAERLYLLGMRAAGAAGDAERVRKLYQRIATLLDLHADDATGSELGQCYEESLAEARRNRRS
jgi:DNA-binding SARP family transcriptional activator